MGLLKVSSKSSPASVAGAIAGLVKDNEPVMLQCIGAGAVNQGIKAIAIAGESRTAIKIAIYVHTLSAPDAQAPVVSSTEFDEVL